MVLNKILKKGKFTLLSGDIFEVPLKDNLSGYFQFLYKDDDYMAGHLIRAFDKVFSESQINNLQALIDLPIKFYTYTRVFEGLKEELWKKVGHIEIEKGFEPPVFRQTNDTYATVKKSYNWFIWQHSPQNKKHIGELTNEYKKLDVSSILPPSAIVEWIEMGWHGFKRPE